MSISKRFQVEERGTAPNDLYYVVIDTQWDKWNLERQAVTLFFRRNTAYRVAELMNEEWSAFLANPN